MNALAGGLNLPLATRQWVGAKVNGDVGASAAPVLLVSRRTRRQLVSSLCVCLRAFVYTEEETR
jgi:hypothetical protein